MAREHVRTRHQFGRPLMDFQGIQWKFADMQIALDAGQLLLYRTATNASNGLPSAQETSIAKAFCNKAGFDICNEAMQVMGGMRSEKRRVGKECVGKVRSRVSPDHLKK